MKLFVPEIGTKLKLEKDWTFKLYAEYRNWGLLKSEGIVKGKSAWDTHDDDDRVYSPWVSTVAERDAAVAKGWEVEEAEWDSWGNKTPIWNRYRTTTIPKDSILTVDRIYIRKGAKEFSSVTFWAADTTKKKIKKVRFWAKLADVNTIEIEVPNG